MISPVEAQFKLSLAAASSWPQRFSNERWADGLTLSDGDLPVAADGTPAPCIEAEVIAGNVRATVCKAGSRVMQRLGLFHLYLSVAQGTGVTTINAQSDALITFFTRTALLNDSLTLSVLRTIDVRIDDGIASYEEGNRFCRLVSIAWEYTYLA